MGSCLIGSAMLKVWTMAQENQQTPPRGAAGECNPENLAHGVANLSPLAQIRRMQRVLFDRTQDEETEDKVISQLACAWERLEGRKAAITMRPAPKPVDVSTFQKRRKPRVNDSPFSDPSVS